jgi:hypothetical protein
MLTMSPDHVYTLELPGQPLRTLPSNTEILADRGVIDKRWYTEASRVRGTYVHEVTAMWDSVRMQGQDIAWDEIPDEYRGFCEAWRKFCREMDFKPLLVEHKLWHSSDYATTIDRLGTIGGVLVLLEIKTGSMPKWVWLQLALQELALVERVNAGDVVVPGVAGFKKLSEYPKKAAVCLKEDGKYSIHEGYGGSHTQDAIAHVRSYHSAGEYK